MHLGSTAKRRLKHVYESVRKALSNSLITLAEYAEECDVTIAVENVQPDRESPWEKVIGKRAEEIVDILKGIAAKNAAVTFDLGYAKTISDPINFAMKLTPYTVNVHLHDNDGSSDQHLVIGEGRIDFPRILRILREIGYTGPLVLEYFDPDSLVKATMELLELLQRF